MQPGELERRLARLAKVAAEARQRLDELGREVTEVRSAIDELAATWEEPTAGEGKDPTSGPEVAQVEAAFK